MLEKQVAPFRRGVQRFRRVLMLLGAAVVCAWGIFAIAALLTPSSPIVLVTPAVIPAPQVHVEVPPAAPAVPPSEPASAPPPRPAVGTSCVVDTSTIGVPVDEQMHGSKNFLKVRASRHGCTIAALTTSTLYVSWDGGQTFADYPSETFEMDAASGRVALLRGIDELGTVRPGDAQVTWRTIPAVIESSYEVPPKVEIAAAGRWTVVVIGKLIVATDDDGMTWRYLTAPDREVYISSLDLDGRLTVAVIEPVKQMTESQAEAGDPIRFHSRRFSTRIVGGRWHELPALPGRIAGATPSWSYAFDTDGFWGCGGSDGLIAMRGGRRTTIASGIRDDAYNVSFAANDDVAFATYHRTLHRIAGAHNEVVAELGDDDPRLVAVDGNGLPLALASAGLVRWSPSGGWRRLLAAP